MKQQFQMPNRGDLLKLKKAFDENVLPALQEMDRVGAEMSPRAKKLLQTLKKTKQS